MCNLRGYANTVLGTTSTDPRQMPRHSTLDSQTTGPARHLDFGVSNACHIANCVGVSVQCANFVPGARGIRPRMFCNPTALASLGVFCGTNETEEKKLRTADVSSFGRATVQKKTPVVTLHAPPTASPIASATSTTVATASAACMPSSCVWNPRMLLSLSTMGPSIMVIWT